MKCFCVPLGTLGAAASDAVDLLRAEVTEVESKTEAFRYALQTARCPRTARRDRDRGFQPPVHDAGRARWLTRAADERRSARG